MTIKTDKARDGLFDSLGLKRLQESYMKEGETSPQERFAYVAGEFAANPQHAQRLYDYASKHWLSFSTPILSYGKTAKGLPISCYLNYMHDSAEGLVDTLSETNWLSMVGGGVGVHVKIRSADGKSVGVMPHLKIYDASCEAYRQGKTRRGSYAVYLDINHPDIELFLDMRKATGDPRLRCENLHHGVNVTDEFMEIIQECMVNPNKDDSFNLRDPSGKVVKTVSAKGLWTKLIQTRLQTGEPYIHFIDTANNDLPLHLKQQGKRIHGSNLCAEIELPTDKQNTAVCCLSSLNLDYWDEWKDNQQFYDDVVLMMNKVLDRFMADAPTQLYKARRTAQQERNIGIGVLGFHSLLQARNLPIESAMAVGMNHIIFFTISKNLQVASKKLVDNGLYKDVGNGMANSHLMAIAPTASTSIILGNTSPSIEPFRANAYRQDTLSGIHVNKNKHLDKIIRDMANDDKIYDEIWNQIIANDGSIQDMDCFTQGEKDVFKTAMELDQRWLVQLAADRQQYIDQGQSLNLFFRPDSDVLYVHTCHFMAWKLGVKALYYCRSDKLRKADKVNQQIERKIIESIALQKVAEGEECLACQ